MEMIVECACDQCGNPVMKPVPIKIQDPPPISTNTCDCCGHETDVFRMDRFQWELGLRSQIGRLCSAAEMKQMRLNPRKFVLETLNPKMVAAGKPELEVDSATTPITVREKV